MPYNALYCGKGKAAMQQLRCIGAFADWNILALPNFGVGMYKKL